MPTYIEGLLGSCLVIPCSYNYNYYAPRRPDRVVWYLYDDYKYPLVCDPSNPRDVINIFYRKTRVFTSSYDQTCTLEIDPVTWGHDYEKIYPWVDPENIGSRIHKFYQKTVMIDVRGK